MLGHIWVPKSLIIGKCLSYTVTPSHDAFAAEGL